jgi:hypothetical protein
MAQTALPLGNASTPQQVGANVGDETDDAATLQALIDAGGFAYLPAGT